jgi:hypothetical protein
MLVKRYLKSPRAILTTCITLIAANLGLVCFLEFTPQVSKLIARSDIQPELGVAYQAPLGLAASRIYVLPTDTSEAPTSSRLTVYEDDRALSPPHSLHRDVREIYGRFSFWNGTVIFSASDGTDPRTNGRAYSYVSSTEVKPGLWLLLSAIVALADAAFLFLFGKDIIFHLRARGGALIITVVGASFVLLAALAACGLFSPIVVAKDGLPKDGALAFQTALHALLGCLTSLGIWAAGAGISRLTARDPRSGLARVLIPAFPIGMVLLSMLLALALIAPWGRAVAFVLWLGCLIPLKTWRPPGPQVTAALKASLGIVPFAAAFGIWLALLWHGPTDTLSGSPSGDLSYYAGNIWSLASQPLPHFDLGSANGATRGYFNNLYPALGAALLPLSGFDPFLFLLASGATSYVLLSTLMLHLYLSDRAPRSIGATELVILTLSILVAARYPYWVAESIPLVFVPALTISVWWMAERGRLGYGWGIAAMLAGLSGSMLSKVVSAALLVPLGFTGVLPHIRKVPYTAKLAALGIAGIFGIYSVAMLAHFIPLFAGNADFGPETYRTPRWYFISRDAGALLMIATAWMAAEKPVALALSFGLATFLAYSWFFQINFVCASIVLGLILTSDRSTSISARMLALTAFALSLPALVLGDQGSASSGAVWIVCLGGAILAAILSTPSASTVAPQLTFRNSALLAIMTLTVTGLGLVGIARGSIIAGLGWHLILRDQLTPELKEIWSAVREHTSKDALIFTDQVDETENILGGWNTYAFSGQRQIYLSSFVTDAELRHDKRKLDQLLAINKAVLDGSRSPQSVPTRRNFRSFYAVVSMTRAIPPFWRPVLKNDRYALYEIVN